LRDIGEARVELGALLRGQVEEAGLTPVTSAGAKARDGLPRFIAAGALLAFIGTALLVGGLGWGRRATVPARVAFDIVTDGSLAPNQLALSPDGTRLVAVITRPTSAALWLRRLDQVAGQILVERANGFYFPFWAADSRFLAFFADGKLNTIDVSSGAPPQPVCDAPDGRGGTWNRDGVMLFAPSSEGPLYRVAAGGGTAQQVTDLNRARGDTAHQHPKFLPDGQHFLFLVRSTKAENSGLYLGSLRSKDTRRLVASDVMGLFAAPDHVLFLREATLMAQRFDPRRFELEGEPFPVAQDVGLSISGNGLAAIAASDTGVLAYRTGTGSTDRILRWVDRTGKPLADVGAVGSHENVALAPGGDRLAETLAQRGNRDIWVVDLQRESSSRLTVNPDRADNAIWSHDGRQIAFASTREGGVRNLYKKDASGVGSDELLLKTTKEKYPTDWSPDGQYLLYTEETALGHGHVWALPLSGGDRKPFRFPNTSADESQARFSPDGHWVAYMSTETGGPQVNVQAFPQGTMKVPVSTGYGSEPRWRRDGHELFYATTSSLWSVDVTTTTPTGFAMGVPRKLFDVGTLALSRLTTRYDVTGDGQRFLLNVPRTSASSLSANPPIRVVVNWTTPSQP
jgi:Tol biopolymer transport system component